MTYPLSNASTKEILEYVSKMLWKLFEYEMEFNEQRKKVIIQKIKKLSRQGWDESFLNYLETDSSEEEYLMTLKHFILEKLDLHIMSVM